MAEPVHPVLDAVRPLLERIGAVVVAPTQLRADDVPLAWDGQIIAGIRLASPTADRPTADRPAGDFDTVEDAEQSGGLDGIIVELERSLGPLSELPRTGKQQAVRLLEESGAFSYRKSVEVVATALGVSRFTVYNYLNRDRD